MRYGLAKNIFNLTVLPNTYQYWKVVTTPDSPLWVSLTSADPLISIPSLYASSGQIPTSSHYDISHCNQEYCNKVPSILQTSNSTEIWFVGVTISNTSLARDKFIQTAIWYNSSCIPGCTVANHGNCQNSSCYCTQNYYGLDCAQVDGLARQYLILIVVASIIVLSTIGGFVVCGSLRRNRKREQYDVISS
eukprot:TRINITY_DN2543_c0_g1_i2.p1 TRINITY_DN2543_c0_g1~~TRINITY_DN2543_c0_g1_i2.p1  ORF type:complete len:191 (-),score=21.68 TRINITY_DN2543_c0_g1_i2:350-922(-)